MGKTIYFSTDKREAYVCFAADVADGVDPGQITETSRASLSIDEISGNGQNRNRHVGLIRSIRPMCFVAQI